MNRLTQRLQQLRAAGRSGLVTYLTAGDPDAATSLALLTRLGAAGADLIELGMPFSDPVADGPTIRPPTCGRWPVARRWRPRCNWCPGCASMTRRRRCC